MGMKLYCWGIQLQTPETFAINKLLAMNETNLARWKQQTTVSQVRLVLFLDFMKAKISLPPNTSK